MDPSCIPVGEMSTEILQIRDVPSDDAGTIRARAAARNDGPYAVTAVPWAVMAKTNPGNFFEDFSLGQVIEHATPRTVTEGDRAVYGAIYPTRFAVASSAPFAASVGLATAPVEELIAFHIAFGKTVPTSR